VKLSHSVANSLYYQHMHDFAQPSVTKAISSVFGFSCRLLLESLKLFLLHVCLAPPL